MSYLRADQPLTIKLKRAGKVQVREIPLKRGVSPYQGNPIHPVPLVPVVITPIFKPLRPPTAFRSVCLSNPLFPCHATPAAHVPNSFQMAGKGDGLLIHQCCHSFACVIWSRRHSGLHVHTLYIWRRGDKSGRSRGKRRSRADGEEMATRGGVDHFYVRPHRCPLRRHRSLTGLAGICLSGNHMSGGQPVGLSLTFRAPPSCSHKSRGNSGWHRRFRLQDQM